MAEKAYDRADSSSSARPPFPWPRMILLMGAAIALLAGLDAALVRLGALAPLNSTDLGTIHGILMVYGFLGTAICLERAVAINSRWAYLSPAASALAGIAAIVISQSRTIANFLAAAPLPAFLSRVLPGYQSQRMLPAVLWTISMITLVMIYRHVWKKRQASYAVLIQLIGACVGLCGILLWMRGLEVALIMPWWLFFLLLTIVGERLELARLAFNETTEKRILVWVGALLISLALTLIVPLVAYPLLGISLAALAIDMGYHDVARKTINIQGIPRLSAVAMLAGYGWTMLPAALWITAPPTFSGYGYDAIVHALTVGFAVSMVIAHAPVIIPSVIRREVPYHFSMWVPLVLFHLSLLIRFLSGAREAALPWRFGGALGVCAFLLFVVTTASVTIANARGDRGSHA